MPHEHERDRGCESGRHAWSARAAFRAASSSWVPASAAAAACSAAMSVPIWLRRSMTGVRMLSTNCTLEVPMSRESVMACSQRTCLQGQGEVSE
jgi:hypothetical protein